MPIIIIVVIPLFLSSLDPFLFSLSLSNHNHSNLLPPPPNKQTTAKKLPKNDQRAARSADSVDPSKKPAASEGKQGGGCC